MQIVNAEKNGGNAMYQITGVNNALLELAIQSCFTGQGYKIKSVNGSVTVFQKGSLLWRILFGVFAKFFKFSVNLHVEGDNATVYFDKAAAGVLGGVFGMMSVTKEFNRMAEELGKCLRSA